MVCRPRSLSLPLLILTCLLSARPAQAADLVVETFDDVSDWKGLDLDTTVKQEGTASGRWDDMTVTTTASRTLSPALDASKASFVGMYLYADSATGARVQVVLDSDNPSDPTGWDYYSTPLTVDWKGWKYWKVPLSSWSISRVPTGWNQIKAVSFNASGWGHTPDPDTRLWLDELRFGQGLVAASVPAHAWEGDSYCYRYLVTLRDASGSSSTVSLQMITPDGFPALFQASPRQVLVPANGTTQVTLEAHLTPTQLALLKPLDRWQAQALLVDGTGVRDAVDVEVSAPLPARPAPRVLLEQADLDRIEAWSATYPWAASARQAILDAADAWPARYQSAYNLSSWELPLEGGQWTLYYICPVHSVYLQYRNFKHTCPKDGATYSGWPYDQVIYAWMHSDLASTAVNLGLAWKLTGETNYATQAADILNAYAAAYLSYPLHDINNGTSASAGRVLAQTLDESAWLVNMAWAFDLIADSGALDTSPSGAPVLNLLRAAAEVVMRNDAGASNWQSWHNAAIGTVGFALEDYNLVSRALQGASGLTYQLEASIEGDGFWYEGAWGYHFFALSALTYLVQEATLAGLDYWDETPFQGMFLAPLEVVMPDGSLPAFNDSTTVTMAGKAGLYEEAWAKLQDSRLGIPLSGVSRGREALLWGAENLPPSMGLPESSTLLPESGYAVLRAGTASNDPTYLALDYGPHGGWHGHYDKLGFVSFGRGTLMGMDPGTQSYDSPYHDTWDKVTVSHNTVVVNQVTQAEATGTLQAFERGAGATYVQADGGTAYASSSLQRSMLMTPDYVLDRMQVKSLDGQPQLIDLAYHNPGLFSTDVSLSSSPYTGLASSHGYQHLSSPKAGVTGADIRSSWDQTAASSSIGSIYASPSTIQGSLTGVLDASLAHTGRGVAKLGYDFSAGDGYLLFTPTAPKDLPASEIPSSLTCWIYGDGSGLTLALRLYDANNERYKGTVGPITWTGWKEITLSNPTSWSHFSGDNDGVFQPPLTAFAVDLTRKTTGAVSGTLYLDDVSLGYASAGTVPYADFEVIEKPMRLWTLGQEGTTLIAANGLGPSLEPVPMVLLRRTASETAFESLLEFHHASPTVGAFSRLTTADSSAAGYAMAGAAFQDVALTAEGAALRTYGGWHFDGTLAWYRAGADGKPQALLFRGGQTLDAPPIGVVSADAPLARLDATWGGSAGETLEVQVEVAQEGGAEVTLRGPGVTTLTVNGVETGFTQAGDSVVFGVDRAEATGCGSSQRGTGAMPAGGLVLLGGLAFWRRKGRSVQLRRG